MVTNTVNKLLTNQVMNKKLMDYTLVITIFYIILFLLNFKSIIVGTYINFNILSVFFFL